MTGHVAVWASNTAGHPGAYLVIQNDANMVVVSPNGQSLWASGAVDYEFQPGQRLNSGWQIPRTVARQGSSSAPSCRGGSSSRR